MQIETRLHSVTFVHNRAQFLAFDIAVNYDASNWAADPNRWALPASAPGALVAFGRWGAPRFAKSSISEVTESAAFDFAEETAEFLGLRRDDLVAAYIRNDGDCVFLVQKYDELSSRARVYVARNEKEKRIGLREQAMHNMLGTETRLLRDRPHKHLFENPNVRFDVIVSDNPSPIVAFFGDKWGLLDPEYVVIAPQKVKPADVRYGRVICDHRALSLRDAALCRTVLELPPNWAAECDINEGFVRVRHERPYLDEVASWARERAEQDEYAKAMGEDLDSAERAISIAQRQAVMAIAPTIARRIVHRHPDLTDEDTSLPEWRAYHADVFGVIKRVLGLSLDEFLDYPIANLVFKACEDAWLSKPFAPHWVRDGEGRYAIRAWWGRHPDGSADIVFGHLGGFDRENWTRVDFREVPDDVMYGLENVLDDVRGRWWRARTAEMGDDIDA